MVTEDSIYKVEAYLDGALPPAEAAELATRLERDPALRRTLEDLGAQRAIRVAAWQHLEGTPGEVEQVADRFLAAARRQQAAESRLRLVRWISAAAAVAAIGFGMGWTGRTLMAPQGAPAPVAHAAPDDSGFRVAVTDAYGNVIAVQQFASFDDARAFSRDLHEWQNRQERLTAGQVLLVGDRF